MTQPILLAEVSDLADRLGQTLTEGTPDYRRAKANIQDVSSLVLNETGQSWDEGSVPPVVVTIVLRASERAFRNPSGAISRTMGPFAEGWNGSNAVGVYLTDAELEILQGLAATDRGFFSIPIDNPVTDSYATLYAYDQFYPNSEPIPYFSERDRAIWGF